MNIEQKAIILSGTSRGIGRDTTPLLAQQGAHVVATARNAAELGTLANEAAEAERKDSLTVVPDDIAGELIKPR